MSRLTFAATKAENFLSPPAGDPMRPQQFGQRQFRVPVAAAPNPRHHLRPLRLGEHISHALSTQRRKGAETQGDDRGRAAAAFRSLRPGVLALNHSRWLPASRPCSWTSRPASPATPRSQHCPRSEFRTPRFDRLRARLRREAQSVVREQLRQMILSLQFNHGWTSNEHGCNCHKRAQSAQRFGLRWQAKRDIALESHHRPVLSRRKTLSPLRSAGALQKAIPLAVRLRARLRREAIAGCYSHCLTLLSKCHRRASG